MHSVLVAAPIYIPVHRLPYVTEDSPIYGTGTTGAFMVFGNEWMEDLLLDDGPTIQDMRPFEEDSFDDGHPFTDVDEVDEVIEADFLEMMDEIDAALDALFAESRAEASDGEDNRMYLIYPDGQRRYFNSGTQLHAAVRSQPRGRVH